MDESTILNDAIHGFIELNEIESEMIKTKPFRRLESINQMGVGYFVYPNGHHTRYEHSLGVAVFAGKIYDVLTAKADHPDIPKPGSEEHAYWRQVVRFAALCHDLGHAPFSHCAEKVLLDAAGHEGWSQRLILGHHLAKIWDTFNRPSMAKDIAKAATGPTLWSEPFTPWEAIVSEIITADLFGADRMDYLLRDSYFTGVNYGKIDCERIIQMLRIVPDKSGKQMLIGVEEGGVDACDFLLIARYYMYKRVYKHRTIKSISLHLGRFLKTFFQDKDFLKDEDSYLRWTDHEVISEVNRAYEDPSHPGHLEAKSILDKRFRYTAHNISDEEFKEILHSGSIPEEAILFEKDTHKLSRSSLLFPVIRKNGNIHRSDSISDFSIQSKLKSWVFVAPEYEQALLDLLAK